MDVVRRDLPGAGHDRLSAVGRCVALCLLAALWLSAVTGCSSWSLSGLADKSQADLATLLAEPSAPPLDEPSAPPAEPPVADDPSELKHDGWARAARDTLPTPERRRWTNPTVEGFYSIPQAGDLLVTALGSTDPVVSTNAAIGLARQGRAEATVALEAGICDTKLPAGIRCAAAEALAEMADGDAGESLERLLAAQEQLYARRAGSYTVALHAELLRGRGRQVPPASEERFTTALAHESLDVRAAALEAWRESAGPLPEAVIDLAADRQPQIRAAAIRAVAAHRAPHATELVEQALLDGNLTVRLAAVDALGSLDGDAAEAQLLELAKADGELVRAAAVLSLAHRGQREPVLAAADDSSWRVRMAVAQCLAHWPDAEAARTAMKLAGDTSADVLISLAEAVKGWPLELAGPVLLDAMTASHQPAREAAARALAAKWAPAAAFVPAAPEVRREEVLAELRAYLTIPEDQHAAAAMFDSPGGATATESEVAAAEAACLALADPDADASLRARARESLVSFGPRLPSIVAVLVERGAVVPEVVYGDLLPRVDDTFKHLAALASVELPVRRKAADQLRQTAADWTAVPLARQRLVRALARERDPAVWRSVLVALEHDSSAEALLAAEMAIGLDDPEVRRRGCLYLVEHPDVGQVDRLAEVLTDTDPEIVRAALAAIAAAGKLPTDDAVLARLLRGNDGRVTVAAARCLALAGDPRGGEALRRLARDADPQVRRDAALAMGEIGDPAQEPVLREMLAGGGPVAKAAAESLKRLAATRPEGNTTPTANWKPKRPTSAEPR